jgi:hypothetical protein
MRQITDKKGRGKIEKMKPKAVAHNLRSQRPWNVFAMTCISRIMQLAILSISDSLPLLSRLLILSRLSPYLPTDC